MLSEIVLSHCLSFSLTSLMSLSDVENSDLEGFIWIFIRFNVQLVGHLMNDFSDRVNSKIIFSKTFMGGAFIRGQMC